jgi:four helix bundle protein
MGYELIQEKAFRLSVEVYNNYKSKSDRHNWILFKQLVRSSSAIGANIEEGIGAYSKKDFANKISLAYKEARESKYWIKLIRETCELDKEGAELFELADELCKILYSIINTTRKNL